MEKRHIVFGAVFFSVFIIGSLNIISDGRFGHAIVSKVPGHAGDPGAEPEISIQSNVTLEQGETASVTAVVRNARTISYTNPTLTHREGRRIDVDADLKPFPRMVQQSLPPTWVYSHIEPEVKMNITLNASRNVKPGNHSFELTAASDIAVDAPESSERFSVEIENSSVT